MRNNRKYNLLVIEEDDDDRGTMLKALGKNLRDLRIKRGLTQEQLGEAAKISYKYLGEVERFRKAPTASIIHKLARALDVPVCELLSTDSCPYTDGKSAKEVSELFSGKEARDVEKACKLLRVFFE